MTAYEFETLKFLNGSMQIQKCNCLPMCTAITYNFEISQAGMNWKQYINDVGRGKINYYKKYSNQFCDLII